MGWDRPLQYYFLVVSEDGKEDEPLYSNLDDESLPVIGTDDIGYFLEKLKELEIAVPETMIKAVQEDCYSGGPCRNMQH